MVKLPQVFERQPTAREEAAKAVGVSPSYVQIAKKIRTEAPEVFQRLKAGTITLQDAKREVAKKPTDDWRKDERERQAAVVAANLLPSKVLVCRLPLG